MGILESHKALEGRNGDEKRDAKDSEATQPQKLQPETDLVRCPHHREVKEAAVPIMIAVCHPRQTGNQRNH